MIKVDVIGTFPFQYFPFCRCPYAFCYKETKDLYMSLPPPQESIDEIPKEVKEENEKIAEFLKTLFNRFGDANIKIQLHDVGRPDGIWKALRHGVKRYPAIIVDGRAFQGVESFDLALEELRNKLVKH
jgi:hypothetical protein